MYTFSEILLGFSLAVQSRLDGTMDLVRVEENLRRKALGILSEEEVSALMESFYGAYEALATQPLAHKKLGRLVTYSRYFEKEDPIRSIDQAVFESPIDYFAEQLKSQ